MAGHKALVELLQGLLVGKVVYDREDPAHVRALGAACHLLEQRQALSERFPLLDACLTKLAPAEDGGQRATLEARQAWLETLSNELGNELNRLHEQLEELDELGGGESAADEPDWQPGGPEAPAFEGVVALDLGTSNLACVHWNGQSADPTVSSLQPVAVNVLDAERFGQLSEASYLTGERALKHKTQVNVYRSFRRLLGTDESARPAITRGHLTQVEAHRLVAAAVKRALKKLAKEVAPGAESLRFPHLVVTFPASGDLTLEYELRRAVAALGLEADTRIDEATAAGVYDLLRPVLVGEHRQRGLTPAGYYAETLGLDPRGGGDPATFLCIDTGGGTTDLSLLQLSVEESLDASRIHVEVIDTAGFSELSGEGLTLFLFGLLKRRLALALSDPARAHSGGAGPSADGRKQHPWLGYHKLEAGRDDPALEVRLERDLSQLSRRWDELKDGREPLNERLTAAVDRAFPTAAVGAPKAGQRVRRALFRFLWDEAERLKREVSDERQRDPFGSQTRRHPLDLSRLPKLPHGVDLLAWLRQAGDGRLPSWVGIDPADIDHYLQTSGPNPGADNGTARLEQALDKLTDQIEGPVRRVLLTGNGTRATRYALTPLICKRLELPAEAVIFDTEQAKLAVAKGACLWAFGNRLEGFQLTVSRRRRHQSGVALVSAVRTEHLFEQGAAIDRFCYAQPPAREGDEGRKLIQVDRVEDHKLRPFLIFNPEKARPLGDFEALTAELEDLHLEPVDEFCETQRDGPRTTWEVRGGGVHYTQSETAMVTEGELFARLRQELPIEAAIAWIESAARLQPGPNPGFSHHRYYMDDDRQLYLIYHARDQKLFCVGQLTDTARRHLPPELDPFSGIH